MATLTVYADIDSFMDYKNADTNYGGSTAIALGVRYAGVDKEGVFRPIGSFDVSGLSGATINSAKMVRNVYFIGGTGGFSAHISCCIRPSDWPEDEVTWNEFSSGNAWTSGGGDFDDTGPPARIDYTEVSSTGEDEIAGLKAFVEDALDNRSGLVSVIMWSTDEDPGSSARVSWRSSEYATQAERWRLVVDYTPAGPAGGLPERGELRGVLRGVVRGY